MPDSVNSSNAPEAPTGRRREYVPSADPGSRLPHMNLRLLSKQLSKVTILIIQQHSNRYAIILGWKWIFGFRTQ